MAESSAKEKLVDLLDRKAFQPVLKKSPDDYDSEAEKRKLQDVQRATESERHRYRQEYQSAEEVRDNFRDDLSSEEAKEVQSELRSLNLPTLQDVEDEFEELAGKLGIGR